jgi:hypothetical protein
MSKISSGCCPFSGNVATVPAPEANVYDALYNSYVQAKATDEDENPPTAFTSMLHEDASTNDTNDFIAIGSDEMLVYSEAIGTEPITIPFRRASVKGFTEITAISHMVPALCYLAKGWKTYAVGGEAHTGNEKYTQYSEYVQNFKTTIQDLASKSDDELFSWLVSTDTYTVPTVYAANADKIKKMFKFALNGVADFIEQYGGSPTTFTIENIQAHFGLVNNSDNESKSLWKGVMVSTFGLIVMNGLSNMVEDNDDKLKLIKWSTAEVLVAGQIGAVSAGLVEGTNSTFKTVDMLAQYYNGAPLDRSKVFFAPFAQEGEDAWKDLPTLYNDFKEIYNNLHDRVEVSQAMFSQIRSSSASDAEKIPDLVSRIYAEMPSIDTVIVSGELPAQGQEVFLLDFLTRRMAFCMEDYRDTLSDCVAGYLLNTWKTSGFKSPVEIAIPGLGLTYE